MDGLSNMFTWQIFKNAVLPIDEKIQVNENCYL